MAPPILILSDMHLTFGGTPLLEGIEMSVSAGERLCVVGRNGSGKSTVLKLAAGLIEADRYNPTLKLCLILARETGRTLDELFWIEGER